MNADAKNAPASDEAVETIRKVYAKDLREKQQIHTVFKVTRKAKQTARSGKSFLALTLGDRSGEVEGRIFDHVDAVEGTFADNDYVLIKGGVISWQKKPQVVIETIEKLDPEPIDPAEFTVPPPSATPAPALSPSASASTAAMEKPETTSAGREKPGHAAPGHGDGARAVAQIREQVERVHDHHVKQLLLAFLDDHDLAPNLPIAPAAKGIHHAYRGGLADHILSVMKLAHRICDHYPMVDRDLVLAGALLHDICKVQEIIPTKGGGFEYTDEGRLVGHLVMCAQKIREKAQRIPGFPPPLEQHLTHIVLSHHGLLEWGSPKVPMTLEALLVHLIDTVDSRVASWLEFMERDDQDGNWTETSRLYDRHLWKGPVPTSRKRSPLEGRAPRRSGRNKKHAGSAPHRADHRGGGDKPQAKGEVPAFKPLSQLAADPVPQAPAVTGEQSAPPPTPSSPSSPGEQT